jgi:peptide/nickel transport system substrate-binding protein
MEYVAITDMMVQNAALLSKGADAVDVFSAPSANGEQVSVLSADPELTVMVYSGGVSAIYPSSLNEGSPFAIKEVRDAASLAIDRQTLSEARGYGILHPAKQIIVEGYYGYLEDGVNYFPFDPAEAKELLAAAGYPDGFKSTIFSPATADKDTTVAIQSMLSAIGIDCELEFPEPALATQLRSKTGWEGLFLGSFTSLASMPSSYRLQVDPDYVYNISTWRPVDEMMGDYILCRSTPTFENEVFQRLHKLMIDNTVVMPILTAASVYIVRDCIRDGEFSKWAAGTQWMPTEVWRSSK